MADSLFRYQTGACGRWWLRPWVYLASVAGESRRDGDGHDRPAARLDPQLAAERERAAKLFDRIIRDGGEDEEIRDFSLGMNSLEEEEADDDE